MWRTAHSLVEVPIHSMYKIRNACATASNTRTASPRGSAVKRKMYFGWSLASRPTWKGRKWKRTRLFAGKFGSIKSVTHLLSSRRQKQRKDSYRNNTGRFTMPQLVLLHPHSDVMPIHCRKGRVSFCTHQSVRLQWLILMPFGGGAIFSLCSAHTPIPAASSKRQIADRGDTNGKWVRPPHANALQTVQFLTFLFFHHRLTKYKCAAQRLCP